MRAVNRRPAWPLPKRQVHAPIVAADRLTQESTERVHASGKPLSQAQILNVLRQSNAAEHLGAPRFALRLLLEIAVDGSDFRSGMSAQDVR